MLLIHRRNGQKEFGISSQEQPSLRFGSFGLLLRGCWFRKQCCSLNASGGGTEFRQGQRLADKKMLLDLVGNDGVKGRMASSRYKGEEYSPLQGIARERWAR